MPALAMAVKSTMRGDVPKTHEHQGVIVGAVAVVANERAGGALRVIELVARETVAHEQ